MPTESLYQCSQSGSRKAVQMSSAWPVVIATSGWTWAQAIRLLRPLTPGLKQASLNVCFVFSCLELVFCFMDYCNLRVRSVCLRMCVYRSWVEGNRILTGCWCSRLSGFLMYRSHSVLIFGPKDDIRLRCVSGERYNSVPTSCDFFSP